MHINVYQVLRLSKCQTLVQMSGYLIKFFADSLSANLPAAPFYTPSLKDDADTPQQENHAEAAGLKSMVPLGRFERLTPALEKVAFHP